MEYTEIFRDEVPVEMFKILHNIDPSSLLNVFYTCKRVHSVDQSVFYEHICLDTNQDENSQLAKFPKSNTNKDLIHSLRLKKGPYNMQMGCRYSYRRLDPVYPKLSAMST